MEEPLRRENLVRFGDTEQTCHATGPYGIEFKAFCHDAMTRVNSYPPPRPRPQPVKELSKFNLADRSRRERTYAFRRENPATTKRRCETCELGNPAGPHAGSATGHRGELLCDTRERGCSSRASRLPNRGKSVNRPRQENGFRLNTQCGCPW